jgi:hypothetical protein
MRSSGSRTRGRVRVTCSPGRVGKLRGFVHVHQALDLRTGLVKATKTGITRRVPVHFALRPLLVALKAELGAKAGWFSTPTKTRKRTTGCRTEPPGEPPGGVSAPTPATLGTQPSGAARKKRRGAT